MGQLMLEDAFYERLEIAFDNLESDATIATTATRRAELLERKPKWEDFERRTS